MKKKPISKKMIIFFTGIICILIIYISLYFKYPDILENNLTHIIGALILISGIGAGCKVADDIQKSIYYKPELDKENA